MRLFWCLSCEKVYPVHPSLIETLEEEEARKGCLETHPVRVLRPIPDSFVSDKPVIEPVKTTLFYATDEDGTKWVVKRWRKDINEPLQYEIFPEEKIRVRITGLRVQEEALQKKFAAETQKAGVGFTDNHTDNHTVLVVAHLKNQVAFDRYYDLKLDNIFENDDSPLRLRILLNDRITGSLFQFCEKFFSTKQYEFLKKFIVRENSKDGVLALVGEEFKIIYKKDTPAAYCLFGESGN